MWLVSSGFVRLVGLVVALVWCRCVVRSWLGVVVLFWFGVVSVFVRFSCSFELMWLSWFGVVVLI